MLLYEFGRLAVSKAGHDKNEVFVILKPEAEYVYLMDGKNRTFDKPKKKNMKHIQLINYKDQNLTEKQKKQEKIINEDIKRAIKLYQNSKM